jgi:adenylate cyclase
MRISRAWRGPAIVLFVCAVLALAGLTTTWRLWELGTFDVLSRLGGGRPDTARITIVGIDESSFAELRRQWPWPRGLHGRLVDSLKRAGAVAIAFDVVFAEASDPGEDEAFAAALGRAGTVVLASDFDVQETKYATQEMQIEPLLLFRQAGATKGLAAVNLDGDLVLRRPSRDPDAFWRAVLRRLPEAGLRAAAESAVDERTLIRYAGPEHTFAYVSYYQALDPEQFLPPGSLKGQIVLVGRDVRATPEPGASQPDAFATPFTAVSGLLMPGVEAHANTIRTMMAGDAVREAPRDAGLLLLIAAVAVAAWLMAQWRPVRSASIGAGLAVLLVCASGWLFYRWNIWIPMLSPLAGIGLTYIARGGVAFVEEQARRRQIKRAFEYYVSPQVVDEMVAHPERLVLGGERRELTILFGDIAGFTSLSESLPPEQIARLLNHHLTTMTGIVLRHGGTVDKFIGDAVMAFWNAPLDDPDHALHGCQAAVEMEAALAGGAGPDPDPGAPRTRLRMRIGINTGPVVVGNMGSADRFDYTAIGDSVNLASRLEGANKLYGTLTLVSGATAAAVGGRVPLRRIDKVRVKGKSEPVEIFSLEVAPAIGALNEEAIEAYRQRDWDRAARCWKALLAIAPEDPVAPVYLDRMATFRKTPPDSGWDGSVALDKL